MNIIWGVEATVNASGSTNTVSVEPMEVWKDVRLSEPTMSFKYREESVNITLNGIVYADIPTNWYLIEN